MCWKENFRQERKEELMENSWRSYNRPRQLGKIGGRYPERNETIALVDCIALLFVARFRLLSRYSKPEMHKAHGFSLFPTFTLSYRAFAYIGTLGGWH